MARYQNKKYLNWVRTQPCVLCGHEGHDGNQVIAHHAISIPGLQIGGVGTKAHDTLAMPMHVLCHRRFHDHFHDFKQDQPIWLMKFLQIALTNLLTQTS